MSTSMSAAVQRIVAVVAATAVAGLAGLAAARSAPAAGREAFAGPETEVRQLVLAPQVQDHFLPAPRRPHLRFRLDARQAAPKTRIMFLQPVAAGLHRMHLEVAGGADRTFVIATPVAPGHARFEISIVGTGRYDFGFWAMGKGASRREYRFTVRGPVARKAFELDL